MSQLDCLLEKQRQLKERSAFKSVHQHQITQNDINNFAVTPNYNDRINPAFLERLDPCAKRKVYVNPNYPRQQQNSVIFINPQVNNSIHFNPNLIQSIQTTQEPKDQYSITRSHVHVNPNTINQQRVTRNVSHHNFIPQKRIPSKCYVNPNSLNQQSFQKDISHNPILSKKVPSKCYLNPKAFNQQIISRDIPNSNPSVCYVNPKLFPNPLTTQVQEENNRLQIDSVINEEPSISTANPINFENSSHQNNSMLKVNSVKKSRIIHNSKKIQNSSFVSISKRKLIRVKRHSKSPIVGTSTLKSSTPIKRRLSSSGQKKTKCSPKNISQLSKVNNMKLVRTVRTDPYLYKKVNKTSLKAACKKNINTKHIGNNQVGLVSIQGIMYESSRNHLVRKSSNTSPTKKKQSSLLNRSSQFYVAKNGKKLLKLDTVKKKVNTSLKNKTSDTSNTSLNSSKNYKSSASNKVKQRSLQILRNKMRKINQPCLIFQKYGLCTNYINGTCLKVHDKKQVAVCKKFLQGKCDSNNCLLSHDVGPEKMPTCKYFLSARCTRDGCPYLHVKLSSNSPICVEFLRGYCPEGHECQKRHIYACPEFDKSGKCSKGKSCQYPHESHTKTKKLNEGARQNISTTTAKPAENIPSTSGTVMPGKRYYDNANTEPDPMCDRATDEDFSKTSKKLLNQIKIAKMKYSKDFSQENNVNEDHKKDVNLDDFAVCEEEPKILCNNRKKPIGSTPAYIPLS